MEYHFEVHQQLRFSVYDIDSGWRVNFEIKEVTHGFQIYVILKLRIQTKIEKFLKNSQKFSKSKINLKKKAEIWKVTISWVEWSVRLGKSQLNRRGYITW